MTPQSLYELVRELPREVWPKDVEYLPDADVWTLTDCAIIYRPQDAASLFVARLVEELAKHDRVDGLWQEFDASMPEDLRWKVSVFMEGGKPSDHLDFWGETLLSALVAAYKAATPPYLTPRTATPQR